MISILKQNLTINNKSLPATLEKSFTFTACSGALREVENSMEVT